MAQDRSRKKKKCPVCDSNLRPPGQPNVTASLVGHFIHYTIAAGSARAEKLLHKSLFAFVTQKSVVFS